MLRQHTAPAIACNWQDPSEYLRMTVAHIRKVRSGFRWVAKSWSSREMADLKSKISNDSRARCGSCGRYYRRALSILLMVPAVACAAAAPDRDNRAAHWAYSPPQRPQIPVVKDQRWPANPIDCFILARLEKEGLRPARPAQPEALLRRVSYDLIGLPPHRRMYKPSAPRRIRRPGTPPPSACSARAPMASNGHGTGWTSPGRPTARGMNSITCSPIRGNIATG